LVIAPVVPAFFADRLSDNPYTNSVR
jgi:hypothetical protein